MDELLDKMEHEYRLVALEQYRHEMLLWALLVPHMKKGFKQPKVPLILREE